MYENYRMPGEFEKRSNVYVTWLPDTFAQRASIIASPALT